VNETVQVIPAEVSGLKINAEPVPTAAETLEHLEQTLDNLDPVVPAVPSGTIAADPFTERFDATADAMIAEVTGDASVEAIEAPAPDDTGSLAEIGHE
jgi:hypothetical protein